MLVNQVGCYGINLGKIDFYFDSDKNISANGIITFSLITATTTGIHI